MPIKSHTNNRVLPTNSRAVDVAIATITAISDTQRLKYHNAFKVQGYEAILYHKLSCGTKCSCQNATASVAKRLDSTGEATEGFMNELLTGGLSFGVTRYGQRPADQPNHVQSSGEFDTPSPSKSALKQSPLGGNTTLFQIDQSADNDFDGALFEDDTPYPVKPRVGSHTDVFGVDDEDGATTVVSSGIGPNGVVHDEDFTDIIPDSDFSDIGYMGAIERSCPVCFGTGYIGGFSVYNGWRTVLNHQSLTLSIPQEANLLFESVPIAIQSTQASWRVVLPFGALSVDAVNVWNGTELLMPKVYVDSVLLTNRTQLLPFCDGKSHEVKIVFDDTSTFTHVELQVNQSDKVPYLDFPETTKSAYMHSMETMTDFTLAVSPIVPTIGPGDYIADSVFGKVYQVKSTSQKNDRRMTIFGWSCEVRVTQPKELVSLLPRRGLSVIPQPKHPSQPRHQLRWRT